MQIENLPKEKELDKKAMSEVRGGDNGNSANNTIGQVLNIAAPTAVGAGGPSNTSVDVTGSQDASIFNDQDAGDSFKALFPGSPIREKL
jgi:hypothetical protein